MSFAHNSRLGCMALAMTLVCVWQPSFADPQMPEASSGMVIGNGNSLLAEGSLALEEGRIAEGIRLTQEGLKDATDRREAARGQSNLCGGYALLRDWTQALQHCDKAVELDPTNWQSFNNRAAVHSGQGKYELALADLRTGLELEPRSSTLHKSMAVVEHNQRLLNKRDRTILRS